MGTLLANKAPEFLQKNSPFALKYLEPKGYTVSIELTSTGQSAKEKQATKI